MDNKPSRRGFFKLGAGGVLAGMAGANALGQPPGGKPPSGVTPCRAYPGPLQGPIAASYVAYRHSDPEWMDVCTAKRRSGQPTDIALHLDQDGWYDVIAHSPGREPDIVTVIVRNGVAKAELRFTLRSIPPGQQRPVTPGTFEVKWRMGSGQDDVNYRIFGTDRVNGIAADGRAPLTHSGNYYIYFYKENYQGRIETFFVDPNTTVPVEIPNRIRLQPARILLDGETAG